jgi:hypothetical protein
VSNPIDMDREISALSSKNARPGEIISMDPQGPVSPATREGFSIWFLYKDVCTEYDHVITAKDQSTVTVKNATTVVFDWYLAHGCKPRILRCDFNKVVVSDEFRSWLLHTYGARVENSVPYAHWQNAVERDVQTVLNGVSTLLHAQRWLRADAWDLALFHYIDCRNRSPNAKCPTSSPRQAVTKEVTDLSQAFLFAFGDLLAVATPGNESLASPGLDSSTASHICWKCGGLQAR